MRTELYYFNIVEDGIQVPDDEGMFLSRQAAHAELLASVHDLTSARMRAGRAPGNDLVELADADGHILETLRFRNVLN